MENKRLNCWEFFPCGREPDGSRASDLGVCPAAISRKVDGMNHGYMGGRVCWAIAGTRCGDWVQGTFAERIESCHTCAFYQLVKTEEQAEFQQALAILSRLCNP